jgi:hypothetical protein
VPTKAKVSPAKLARAVERLRHQLYRLHQGLAPPPIAMVELTLGAWVSQAVQVAAELGIADALAEGPLPLDELANRVGADADALKRLIRALISRGVFRQHRDGRYGLTPLADTLRFDAPVSVSGLARFIGSPQHREHWSLLAESVRTGKTIIPGLRGKEFFDYLADDPEFAKLFNHAMTSVSEIAEATVIAGYDFSPYSTLVDVGAAGRADCWLASWRRRQRQRVCFTTCRKSSRERPRYYGRGASKTVCAARVGRSSTESRLAAPHMSSRASSTTGPMSRPWRFCEACMRQPVATRRCY